MNHAALIYSHSITPRLKYIVEFLSAFYGLSFRLTPDEESFLKSDHPCRINYSYHRVQEGEIWIHPHALLFESAVRPVKVECFEHEGHPAFFKTEGDLSFDLFAAVFYLITRYEEYLPHKKDAYGRYAHQNSVAFREGFLNLPLVNIWLEDFREVLAQRNAAFQKPATRFRFLPTYDIDMAWSFRNKGFRRNTGALLKLFFKGSWRQMARRIGVLRRRRPDPFDAYEWMDTLHQRAGLKPLYFFLVAQQRGKHDRNIDVENPEFRALIKTLASQYTIGLHPSWASGDLHHLLPKEKRWLENHSARAVHASRQHFIRFELPATYRRLITNGITEEYSMGYGTINGFRASIATPYYWYDLKNDEATKLTVIPFCFMDANSFYEQKQTAEETLEELRHYRQVVQQVNGTLVTIWHNSFLGECEDFEGWKEVYARFVSELKKEVTSVLQ